MSNTVTIQAESCTDEALLTLIVQKDANAFNHLYDRHVHTVFHLLLSITRDQALAEELLQDTFWQIWQKADQFEGTGSAAAWLSRIARNKALDALRRQRCRAKVQEKISESEYSSLSHYSSTEQLVEQDATHEQIATALAQLPVEQRHCLELAYFEGLSQTEIAAYTDLPLGTIKTRLRCGREKVERWLRAIGYQEHHATLFT